MEEKFFIVSWTPIFIADWMQHLEMDSSSDQDRHSLSQVIKS